MSQSQSDDSFSDNAGAAEIILFGVRVKIDPIRKSVSMNNLSQYEQPANHESVNNNLAVSAAVSVAVAADTGYATADDAVRRQFICGRERKRGVPWTEDEHKLFLLGLQKVGKGDWRGISRNFVKTRTPTQVASHAQKYFLRRSNLNRRRRRSSLFDITTDSVSAMSTEPVNKETKGQAILEPSIPSSQQITPISPVEMVTFNNPNQVNIASTQLGLPMPVFPTSNSSTRMHLNLNQTDETDPSPISLNLSLSFDPNRSSQYRAISGFNTGESMIRVA